MRQRHPSQSFTPFAFLVLICLIFVASGLEPVKADHVVFGDRIVASDQMSPLAVTPTILRYWPDTQTYSINVGTAIQFSIGAEDSDGDLKAAEWFLGLMSKYWNAWSGRPKYYAESLWTYTFSQSGDFYVYAYVYDDANSWSFIWWKITVTNQNPTVSRISPRPRPTAVRSTMTTSPSNGRAAMATVLSRDMNTR